MFTGIVQELGKVKSVVRKGSLTALALFAPISAPAAAPGDSIAVNGTCLTVIKKQGSVLFFDAVAGTLERTNIKRLKAGDAVNLEPALKVGDKLGGHFVLGHVDTEARIKRIERRGKELGLEIELAPVYAKAIVANGSVAIDGISLTVKAVKTVSFTVDIIPFTWANTTLKNKRVGDRVNVEFDYLLKRV